MLATGLLAEVGFVILVVQLLPRRTPIVWLAQQCREHTSLPALAVPLAPIRCAALCTRPALVGWTPTRGSPSGGWLAWAARWMLKILIGLAQIFSIWGQKTIEPSRIDWPNWGLGQGVCLGSMVQRGQGSAGSA